MDILPLFVQTLTTLSDRIKNIKDSHIQNRQQAFEKIIQPLFFELKPVVDNYFILFREAKHLAAKSSVDDLGVSVQKIRDSRDALLRIRIEVREMANSMSQIYNDKKIIEFARKVDGFFYRTVCERKIRGKSYALELVDFFDYVHKKDIEKSVLISFIDSALANMETSWVAIAQSYATLSIYCLSQPKEVKTE